MQLIACGVLIFSCVLCVGVSEAATGARSNTLTTQVIATDTPTATQVVIAVTNDTPTDIPTAAATPTAIPTPTPTATPTPVPTQRPTPTPTPGHTGVNGNPWGYDFNPGNLIYIPPSGFCSYFNCIPTFSASDDPGDGYIVECVDGQYSQSGGERGACSGHTGVGRSLYSH